MKIETFSEKWRRIITMWNARRAARKLAFGTHASGPWLIAVGCTRMLTACSTIVQSARCVHRGGLSLVALLALPVMLPEASSKELRDRHGSLFGDAALFKSALDKERPASASATRITGLTVPHHLLAADLIARGVWAAAGQSYDRIILISPDHFRRSRLPVATTRRGFDTALGPIEVDTSAVDTLLGASDLVEDSDLFSQEHGVSAILPFLHAVLPNIPIVPIALGVGTVPEQWSAAVDTLKTITTPRTLIVQSTDFSHYLLPQVARARDQETLNVIATADPQLVAKLNQSNHLDSKASQYVQLRLQAEVFGSTQVVVANRNSSEYVPIDGPSTSYLVSAFGPDKQALSRLAYADQKVFYFGGDVFLGRWFTAPLLNEAVRERLVESVRRITAGGPLIVNLEGVLASGPVTGAPAASHVMDTRLAAPVIKALRVEAASLANNHSFDLGTDGVTQTVASLKRNDVRALIHGRVADLGAFRLLPLNFIGRGDVRGYPVVKSGIEQVCHVRAAPPFFAFVHWGQEYTSEARAAEREVAERLARCGVDLVIGAHSHQASPGLDLIGGGKALMEYSLGNLLFDQLSPRGSGAILEVRLFAQGTFATRIIPAPNLYDLAVQAQ